VYLVVPGVSFVKSGHTHPRNEKVYCNTGQTSKTPRSAATPDAKCRHTSCQVSTLSLSSLHLHETQPQYSGSVRSHISCPNLPKFLHLRFIPPGRSLLDCGTFLSSAAEPAQSVVHTLRVKDPRLQFSRVPNAQSGCGTCHIQLRAVDITLLGSERCTTEERTTEWAERCTANKVPTSAPQPTTSIMTPNGSN
jgi:hypothetical protein